MSAAMLTAGVEFDRTLFGFADIASFVGGTQNLKEEEGLMNGPQIDTTKVDVVGSQEQVDDLLGSLGF